MFLPQNQDVAIAANPTANGTLTSVGPIAGADHLAMSYMSWQEQTFAQGGEGGALEWLLQQTRPKGGG